MCGLTGFWQFNKQTFDQSYHQIVSEMASFLESRGPDDKGTWVDAHTGLALGHRRLSILDISPAGHQPMHSHSKRFVIAYNGEIYNAFEIRKELETTGIVFKSRTDTEVILEAVNKWGVYKTVQKCIGMFAFALWDKQERKLYLVRDRLGIKPLYWGRHRGVLFFGSQLKSFKGHPSWNPELNKQALVSYFRFNYVPTPLSIYQGIHKLPPGTILQIDSLGQSHGETYWDFKTLVKAKSQHRSSLTDQEAVQQLEDLLKDAIAQRMLSDVPIGAFLSGGVDSSTVVALMQAQSTCPVKTFSIGFHEQSYNEAPYAKKVATYLKTDHHEVYLSSQEAQMIIPKLSNWYDEPFADISQIPTFLVSQITREHVTVALSGDGGDELFGGYNRYLLGQSIWKKLSLLPGGLRALGGSLIDLVPSRSWDRLGKLVPSGIRFQHMGDKMQKFASVLRANDFESFYRNLVSHWDSPEELVPGESEIDLWRQQKIFPPESLSVTEKMQFMDTLTYLPDDILTKVDRASMAVSLEARVPFLDHRVVEWSWDLPESMKIRHGQRKWILRQILYGHVPKEFIDRPKMGFSVPIGQWMRESPLREWSEDLLAKKALEENGLNPVPIRQLWQDHLRGDRNGDSLLWSVLMYQSWKQEM